MQSGIYSHRVTVINGYEGSAVLYTVYHPTCQDMCMSPIEKTGFLQTIQKEKARVHLLSFILGTFTTHSYDRLNHSFQRKSTNYFDYVDIMDVGVSA